MKFSEKFDWSDLQLLLAVASSGYINDAASTLGVDPTTITRRIKRLEKRLGLKLVERIKGGVVLSEDCERLVRIARNLSREMENAFPQDGSEPGMYGMVRISVSDFLVDLLLDDLVALQADNPGLVLDIDESYSQQSLSKRQTDIAVRITEEPNEALVGLRQEGLQFSVYRSRGLRSSRAKGRPWISWSLPQFPHDKWISEYDPKGRIVMRTDSIVSHAKLVCRGVGVAVLPDVYVSRNSDLSGLVRVEPVWQKQSLWVLTHAELRNVPRIRATMRTISNTLRAALAD